MPDEKQKILSIMKSLERDYRAGKVSPQKYRYYMAKYQDRLRYLDKHAATNRIRSMQGKPAPDIRRNRNRYNDARNRQEEKNGLVQKYIINPKKDDRDLNKKNKKSMDSSTYKLFTVLILVIGLTLGIAVGVFAMNFEDLSVVHSDALVVDTSFPDISNVTIDKNDTSTQSTDNADTGDDTQSEDQYVSGGGSSSSNTQPGGAVDSGGQNPGGTTGDSSNTGGGQDSGTV